MISSMEVTALCTVLLLFGLASGQDECQSSVLSCYECDSRQDPNCADPFNKTLSAELLPSTRQCKGCCVKFLHKYANEEWVQRTCTENVLMEFPADHVCMIEGKGHGNMCFCEEDLCNTGAKLVVSSTALCSLFSLMLEIYLNF